MKNSVILVMAQERKLERIRKLVISVEVVDKLMLFVIHRLVGCKLKQLVMSVMEQVRKLKKNVQLVMVQVMKKLHILLK